MNNNSSRFGKYIEMCFDYQGTVTGGKRSFLFYLMEIGFNWNKCNIPFAINELTLWGRVPHICVSNLTIIGSDNGLPPGRRQAIIWNSAGIFLIRTLGRNFSEMWSEIHTFSIKKMHLKMSSAKWWQFCLGLNVLIGTIMGLPQQQINSLKPSNVYMRQ